MSAPTTDGEGGRGPTDEQGEDRRRDHGQQHAGDLARDGHSKDFRFRHDARCGGRTLAHLDGWIPVAERCRSRRRRRRRTTETSGVRRVLLYREGFVAHGVLVPGCARAGVLAGDSQHLLRLHVRRRQKKRRMNGNTLHDAPASGAAPYWHTDIPSRAGWLAARRRDETRRSTGRVHVPLRRARDLPRPRTGTLPPSCLPLRSASQTKVGAGSPVARGRGKTDSAPGGAAMGPRPPSRSKSRMLASGHEGSWFVGPARDRTGDEIAPGTWRRGRQQGASPSGNLSFACFTTAERAGLSGEGKAMLAAGRPLVQHQHKYLPVRSTPTHTCKYMEHGCSWCQGWHERANGKSRIRLGAKRSANASRANDQSPVSTPRLGPRSTRLASA
ncbi:hypothetical protein RJ55_08664 [Drechmeria coniospora]|nr:hypothetical protein RJ55_08664 [Drechmeria coniospora]